MLRSSLYDYKDAFIFFKGTITVANTEAQGQVANNGDKKVILKNYAPFTNCICRKKQYPSRWCSWYWYDVLMPMYNLIEYMVIIQKHLEFSDNIRDEPGLDDNYDDDVVRFNTPNATTNSFEIKENVTGQTGNNGILKQLH